MKWSFPHFMYKGMLASMASFKNHCTFGFWKGSLLEDELGDLGRAEQPAMGQFGRIMSLSDLPAEKVLIGHVRKAAELNDRGVGPSRKEKPKADRKQTVPTYLMAALRRNKKALATFQGFSDSHRKEYVEWIAEARGEETRKRRLETAVEWMAEGKNRNGRYIRK